MQFSLPREALLRVLGISLASVFAAFAILVTLRFWGLSLPINEFQSDFFSEKKPWLAFEITTSNEIESVLKKSSGAILFLDLRLSADQILFIQAPQIFEQSLQQKKFKPEDYKGRYVSDYTYDFLKKEFPGIFPLEEVFQKYPEQKMILNLIDNSTDIHKVCVNLLKKYQLGKKIVIHSPIEVVLKSIKELEPLWTFGTSQAEITRVLSLNSIQLLPAASMRSDVYITPLRIMNRSVFNTDLNQELLRRKKKIMFGPLQSFAEYEEAKKFTVDGYILKNLSDFEAALTQ